MSADVLLGLPVVVLSHRGPVSFTADEGGEREVHRGAGGLVPALTGLAAYLPAAVWVCVAPPGPDATVAREAAGQLVRLDLGPPTRMLGGAEPAGPGTVSLRLVEVPAQVHEPFYGVIAQPAAVVRATPAVRAGPGAGPGTRRARRVGAGLRRRQPAGRRRRRGAGRQGRWAGHRAAARLPLLPRRGPAAPALPPAAAPAPIRVQKTLQSSQRCCATAQARFLPVPEVAGRARCSVLGRGAG